MTEHVLATEKVDRNQSTFPALKAFQYGSVVDSDTGSPSDDEKVEPPDYPEATIAVSISRIQTRLASPKTPAIEKAAAIENSGGFFSDRRHSRSESVVEVITKDVSVTTPGPDLSNNINRAETATPRNSDALQEAAHESGRPKSQVLLSQTQTPSPFGPKALQRSTTSSDVLREGVGGKRQRSSSESECAARMQLLIGFPSPPKGLSLWGDAGAGDSKNVSAWSCTEDRTTRGVQKETQLHLPTAAPQLDGPIDWARESLVDLIARARSQKSEPTNGEKSDVSRERREVVPSASPRSTAPKKSSRADGAPYPNLRRSKSIDSWVLQRTFSQASSLGDDSRFENVQEMVNSRLKAIKDSLQDTNFRLPLLKPPSIFSSSRSDLSQNGGFRSSSMVARRPLKSDIRQSNSEPFSAVDPPISSTFPAAPSPKAREGTAGMNAANAAAHPYFSKALEQLSGDVVILGGYRGSVLREAKHPHRRVWVPIKVGLGLRKVDLEVGLNPEDEERMSEKIIPGGMLTHIGPVDMARRLLKRLRASDNVQSGKLRVHDYGYDWRLSPDRLARDLIHFLEKLPSNGISAGAADRGATVIAHSLGGLITRWAVNRRPELFSGVVYAGTPQTCVNILGPMRNGDDVLLSSRVLTAQVNFSIRTSFALLPLNGRCFLDKRTGEEYPVDFFDVRHWEEYRLSPCIAPPLPPLTSPLSGRLSSFIGTVSSISDSMADMLPSLPFSGRRSSQRTSKSNASSASPGETQQEKKSLGIDGGISNSGGIALQMGGNQKQNPAEYGRSTNSSVATAVTIPKDKALEYLSRTLYEIKQFKQNLAFIPSLGEQNKYPPVAVIYGKSEPTVSGARVDGREGIKRADAFDDLVFGSGDGVVLSRAAMLPDGYKAVRGGVVASERGHVTLLGDLEAIGRCLCAVYAGRRLGVGLEL